ncbi:MAG: branched-chain amino acid ABC transporter permease, partial [Pseudomonadota bacterium]
AGVIKYFEAIFSRINKTELAEIFSFLPPAVSDLLVSVTSIFVGKGWHLTLGLMFMLVVIFLPGGLMEGLRRIGGWFKNRLTGTSSKPSGAAPAPAE